MHCRQMTTVRVCLALAVLVPSMAIAQGVNRPITSVPPAAYRPAAVEKAATSAFTVAADTAARRIDLAAPSASEITSFKALNAASPGAGKRVNAKALAVGFGREMPVAARTVPLSALAWVATSDGGRSARIEIRSPEATAVRVAMQLPSTAADFEVRVKGSGASSNVFGPIVASAIAQDTARFGRFWTPVLEGDVATIELHAGPGVVLEGAVLTLPSVSHQVVSNAELRALSAKTVNEIGRAQSCNIDVACVSPSAALSNAAKSVAQLLFVGDDLGRQYLCTGTLLNDSIASSTPYLFTAAHCMDSARAANTLNTFWFFDAISCGNNAVPPYVQLIGGAALLGRSEDHDWALVRLKQGPPAGSWLSGWNAVPVPLNAITTTLHHPQGDLKKWSQGYVAASVFDDDSNVYGIFNEVRYTAGITEGGSSGSALLTDAGGYFEVRGGLSEGTLFACPSLNGWDDYSRVEDMVPLVRQYLTPGSTTPGEAVAVEFYNKTLDHYFLSTNPSEINDLDTGVHVGWERTGLRFLAFTSQSPGTSPVCRFYREPSFGDSHFYSASPAECAATAAAHPLDWVYESAAVFYILLPDGGGNCAVGTVPLWRFFNTTTTNHRYTAEVVIRDRMRADPAVWTAEGNGPGLAVMCAASL